jgi:uncharacterized membrane protein
MELDEIKIFILTFILPFVVALFIQCLLKRKKQREFGDLEATSKSGFGFKPF